MEDKLLEESNVFMMRKKIPCRPMLCLLIIVIAGRLSFGCEKQRQTEPISETRFLLNTVCTITIYDMTDSDLLRSAFELIERYEAVFSVTIEGSDVWRVNEAGGETVEISYHTANMIRSAVDFAGASGGMFDITIGRLSSLWDFSSDSPPEQQSITGALQTVDYKQIVLDEHSMRLNDPAARIDLGGIAKGYIADMVAVFLMENGVESAVIDLGGNIIAVGHKPDGTLWRIGVREPFGQYGQLLGVLETGQAAVVTSGIYERSFVYEGILYHHILDPFTGKPASSDVISATILSENSMTGDVLSTVAVLIGSQKAVQLFEQTQGYIGAVMVLENGELVFHGDTSFTVQS